MLPREMRDILIAFKPAFPWLIAEDGFTMSIQAGFSLWSTPRVNFAHYEEVEIGFPSAVEKTLVPYVELTGDVFEYVPVKIVDKIISKHGGVPDKNLIDAKLEFQLRVDQWYRALSKL